MIWTIVFSLGKNVHINLKSRYIHQSSQRAHRDLTFQLVSRLKAKLHFWSVTLLYAQMFNQFIGQAGDSLKNNSTKNVYTFICKLFNNVRTSGPKEDHNQVLQESRRRAARLPANVNLHHSHNCFLQSFLNGISSARLPTTN